MTSPTAAEKSDQRPRRSRRSRKPGTKPPTTQDPPAKADAPVEEGAAEAPKSTDGEARPRSRSRGRGRGRRGGRSRSRPGAATETAVVSDDGAPADGVPHEAPASATAGEERPRGRSRSRGRRGRGRSRPRPDVGAAGSEAAMRADAAERADTTGRAEMAPGAEAPDAPDAPDAESEGVTKGGAQAVSSERPEGEKPRSRSRGRGRGRRGGRSRSRATPETSAAAREESAAPAEAEAEAEPEGDEPVEEEKPKARPRSRGRGRGRGRGAAGPRADDAEAPPDSSRGRTPSTPAARPSTARTATTTAARSGKKKLMLINVAEPEESRIAILEGSSLDELYIERKGDVKRLGNIYKGRVVNIEPSIQAAFIDFGAEINGFLHVSDLMPPEGGGERSGRRTDIQDVLKKNQEVLVQVTKDQIGSKGPALTTYVSIPGRYLVLMPSLGKCGVSRKITDEDTRKQLKKMMKELDPPKGLGFIIRTAGIDRTKRDLQRDLDYLMRLWTVVEKRVAEERAPATIYQESDLITRTIRDIFDPDVAEILIDTEDAYVKARDFLGQIAPRYQGRVKLYDDPKPLFHRDRLEEQIENIWDKTVQLPSGGSIVIEQTEALVAIDVNSGKFKDEKDPEETALKTNLEAAHEIARQLRLRDLGGLIIQDYIDMRDSRYRRKVERAFKDALKGDRARKRTTKMSAFCIIEMTRQRVGPSLRSGAYDLCPTCGGSGSVKTIENMGLKVLREIRGGLAGVDTIGVDVWIHRRVADYINNIKRRVLLGLEDKSRKAITVNVGKEYRLEDYRIVFHRKGGYNATRTNMKQSSA